jgi:hypothetical protein
MAENYFYLNSLSQEKREEYDRLRAIEREREREIETRRAKGCFDAEINDDGKYFCPECKRVEGGTLRTLTHNFGCTNNGLKICQLSQERERKIETTRAKGCFDAEINDDGKYFCPECKQIEGGITHFYNCKNKGLEICQLSQKQSAGRKRRRNKTNKKTKRTKKQKRSTKVRKSMRRHRKH